MMMPENPDYDAMSLEQLWHAFEKAEGDAILSLKAAQECLRSGNHYTLPWKIERALQELEMERARRLKPSPDFMAEIERKG